MAMQAVADRRSRSGLAAACGVLALATAIAAAGPGLADPATIRIGGTGSALGGIQLLAEAFTAEHPGTEIVVLPNIGSGGGIRALLADAIDVALSNRPLRPGERALGAVDLEYSRTPLVFATRADTAAGAVTLEQVARFYDGRTTVWPDGHPLRLVLRHLTHSDHQALRALSGNMDRAVQAAAARPGLLVALTDQDNAASLEDLPGSLGITTLGQIVSEERWLKPLVLDGVAPGPATVASGDYPLFKSLYLVTRAADAGAVAPFVAFVRSPAGRAILEPSGYFVVAPGSME